MKKNIQKIIKIFFIIYLIVLILPRENTFAEDIQQKSEEYFFRRSWGDEGSHVYPSDLAISPDGILIYAADPKYHRVLIIDRLNRTYQTFGENGTSEGKFINPNGIAIDKEGSVYVADYGNFTVQKFSSNGQFIKQFVNPLPGDYWGPHGIAVDSDLTIYVVDWREPMIGNPRMLKISQNGSLLGQLESCCDADYTFQMANALDIDSYGNIYLTDSQTDRILKYTNNFTYITQWGTQGSEEGQVWKPKGIDVDQNGRVYIADTNNHRVQIFNDNGVYFNKFGSFGTLPSQFSSPRGIDVDLNGNIYVADSENARIQKFDSSFNFKTQYGDNSLASGYFSIPSGISSSQDGNIYVADTLNNRIQKFNKDGVFIQSWGSYGGAPGQFFKPHSLVVDSINHVIYVADTYNFRIQKFSMDGTFLLQWGNSQLLGIIYGIALDTSGNIYIVDESHDRIQKYSPQGQLLNQWGETGSNPGQLGHPRGIGLDSVGNIYVTEDLNKRIQKFSSNGESLDTWNVAEGPWGILIREDGQIFITNISYHKIFEYDNNGNLIGTIGSQGNNPGQFFFPRGIDLSIAGNIYIADAFNNRIQEMSTSRPVDPQSGLIQNGDFDSFSTPEEWTYGGDLPLSIVNDSSLTSNALQIGQPVIQASQGENKSWVYQTIYVDPTWARPIFNFKYNMFVNDILDYSDFFVEIQDGAGHDHLATVIRDGYQPCVPGTAPAAGTNLGWRSVNYDLSAYKGQHIRLVFSNRNLWPISWGIWTYVDDVKVVDAGPLPSPAGSELLYLPLVNNQTCDPVTKSGVKSSEDGFNYSRPPIKN